MSRSCCTPGDKCDTWTCKKFVSLPNFSLLSPVSSLPLFLPRLYSCPFCLPWFPTGNVRFENMEESRVFRVPFSSRSVSRHETKSGAGGNLFQPICLQSWLLAAPSKIQRASLSAFPPCKGAAAPDQVRSFRPLSQPENIYFTLDIIHTEYSSSFQVHYEKIPLRQNLYTSTATDAGN